MPPWGTLLEGLFSYSSRVPGPKGPEDFVRGGAGPDPESLFQVQRHGLRGPAAILFHIAQWL